MKKSLEVLSWDLVALRVLQALLEEEFRSIILGSGRLTCLYRLFLKKEFRSIILGSGRFTYLTGSS